MIDRSQIIEDFITSEGITFELRAVNSDGEVLAKQTSSISADDLAGRGWIIDEAIEKLALQDTDDEDFSGATEGDR